MAGNCLINGYDQEAFHLVFYARFVIECLARGMGSYIDNLAIEECGANAHDVMMQNLLLL